MSNIIRQKRNELGLSQTALSDKIGVSQVQLDRYEKGATIPFDKILKISKILNISRWDLLPDEFNPKKIGIDENKNPQSNINELKSDIIYIVQSINEWLNDTEQDLPIKNIIEFAFLIYDEVKMIKVQKAKKAEIIRLADFLSRAKVSNF